MNKNFLKTFIGFICFVMLLTPVSTSFAQTKNDIEAKRQGYFFLAIAAFAHITASSSLVIASDFSLLSGQ